MTNLSAILNRVARGKHGSENLSRNEACTAFDALLHPDADPLQLGAFLIAQRMKGETSEELAGFIDAARQHCVGFGDIQAPENAVDLPCYAGKRRAPHAHLAAALTMPKEGIPTFIHGVEQVDGRITAWQILEREGVQRAKSLPEATEMMLRDGIVYMDLSDISPHLYRIYQLRSRLGVRSFSNTVARMINPLQCAGQLNGMFHTPYADYMAQANALLQQPRSLIFMGAEGEPELYADRQKLVKMQTASAITSLHFADSGFPPYPKQALEPLDAIFPAFQQLRSNQPTPQDAATIQRMQQAFRWASGKTVQEAPYAPTHP